MKRTPLAALALVALLASLLVSGCDDEVEPEFAPPESTSPAPTDPTTSTTAEPEKLSPEETVRAWVEAQNVALQTGDTGRARALSDRCESCLDFIDPIQETYDSGGSYQTEGWSVVSLELQHRQDGHAEVAAGIQFAAGERTPEAGADPVSFEAEKNIMLFELSKVASVWTITLVGFVP